MGFLDIIILIVLLYGLVKGIIRGFILQFFSLIGVFIGIYAAKIYALKFTLLISQWFSISTTYAKPITYLLIFCAVILCLHLLAKLLDKSIKVSLVNWVNKLLGALLGILKYALILSILLTVFQALDKNSRMIKQSTKNKSVLYSPILNIVPRLMPTIDTHFLKQ
ncbi:MAG: CvpA family protein [Paludibacteraceae bacterium]|nr:CvpA family protein [Paludibacteraceae bacterium]